MTRKGKPLSLQKAFSELKVAPHRTPESKDIQEAFCQLAEYRDGGIFLAHYAGNSEWEKHPDDEIVIVIEGQTSIFMLQNPVEETHSLSEGELIVVPKQTWHRFESPDVVKIMTVTPQPTEHSLCFPEKYDNVAV
ncbi:cupin domain-containing protein [Endozoicomonas numazuensis]|uniref:Cupin n=1 Tax=Endozoicomonas numazuensis TaxID=1137799 RepID=A0A081NHK5_9GAMM|nr:cupin domain-containing protein [Endozoicomonas numazuensis]KEQ17928.1 cupin [Endozoicomonas numazuensis]